MSVCIYIKSSLPQPGKYCEQRTKPGNYCVRIFRFIIYPLTGISITGYDMLLFLWLDSPRELTTKGENIASFQFQGSLT